MSFLEVAVTLLDQSTASYVLGPHTTIQQLRELLKADEFIEGNEMFTKYGQNNFIPKSQETIRQVKDFLIGDLVQLAVVRRTPPSQIVQKEEQKETEAAINNPGQTSHQLGAPVDSQACKFGSSETQYFLNKASYLFGRTISSGMKLAISSQSFFETLKNDLKLEKCMKLPLQDLIEKYKVTQNQSFCSLYNVGLFDLEQQDNDLKQIKSLMGLGDADQQQSQGKKYAYAEISFPKISVIFSDLRSVLNSKIKQIFQNSNMVTKSQLESFFNTFGMIMPEAVTLGGKIFVTKEFDSVKEDAGKFADKVQKELADLVFKDKQGEIVKKSMLQFVGGTVGNKGNTEAWIKNLQENNKSWEVISIDSWRWTFEYLDDSLCVQVKQVLETPNFKDKIAYQNGDLYEGDVVNKKKEGYGKLKWKNGDAYEGQWANDLMEGYGVMDWASGNHYEGYWVKQQREGYGTMRWNTGEVYEGNWEENQMEGEGKMRWPNGDLYEGGWIDSKRGGYGKMKWQTGNVYEGYWLKHEMSGEGKLQWVDGNRYEGEFLNGFMHGYGKIKWSNGDKYEGQWEKGTMQGYGLVKYANGSSYEGQWINGKRADL